MVCENGVFIRSVEVYLLPAHKRLGFCANTRNLQQTTVILRLKTNVSWLEGVGATQSFRPEQSPHKNSFCERSLGLNVASVAKHLIGSEILLPDEKSLSADSITEKLAFIGNMHQPISPQTNAVIDIAVWDLQAKRRKTPLYLLFISREVLRRS